MVRPGPRTATGLRWRFLTTLGIASWDDGSGTAKSVKYTWFDENDKAARGGEFPAEALPQALDFAIRKGLGQPLTYQPKRPPPQLAAA